MSQAKVDAYKVEKKNRKQEIQKAKRRKVLTRVIIILVAIVVLFWIVFSAYRYYQNHREITPITVDTSSIFNFELDE